MRKYSKQREAILTLLASRTDHPTAETLYHDLRETMPRISLGTVYRNLMLAAREGDILRLPCADGIDRFDGTISEHYHVQCTCCHRVMDIPSLCGIMLDAHADAHFQGTISGHSLMFYGTCEDCQPVLSENSNIFLQNFTKST